MTPGFSKNSQGGGANAPATTAPPASTAASAAPAAPQAQADPNQNGLGMEFNSMVSFSAAHLAEAVCI